MEALRLVMNSESVGYGESICGLFKVLSHDLPRKEEENPRRETSFRIQV
jgi:hypothetical protein